MGTCDRCCDGRSLPKPAMRSDASSARTLPGSLALTLQQRAPPWGSMPRRPQSVRVLAPSFLSPVVGMDQMTSRWHLRLSFMISPDLAAPGSDPGAAFLVSCGRVKVPKCSRPESQSGIPSPRLITQKPTQRRISTLPRPPGHPQRPRRTVLMPGPRFFTANVSRPNESRPIGRDRVGRT
jgi:hypothetical protein